MVAAGIYLLFKTYFLLTPDAKEFIAVIGATTCLLGAIPAIFQNDIKKVLAYSTVSQLGYMVMAIGTNSKEAAMFHLTTHAFFKACLFLSVGAVIHHMHHIKSELFGHGEYSNFDSQDMRFMGGLWKIMPIPFYCYLISCLSLIGLPLFSGFLSKEMILVGAFVWSGKHGSDWHILVPLCGVVTVFITALYMSRQLILVFFGKFKLYKILGYNGNLHSVKEDIKISMPLILLAFTSFFFFFSINPFHIHHSKVLEWISGNPAFDAAYSSSITMTALFLSLLGIASAYVLWGRNSESRLGGIGNKYPFLGSTAKYLKGNYSLDTFYFKSFVLGGQKAGALLNIADRKFFDVIIHSLGYFSIVFAHVASFIDRYFVDGIITLGVYFTKRSSKISKSLQMGTLQNYFLAMILGIIILLIIYL
jgi:NADH-quinone oxidoreductase subunit L